MKIRKIIFGENPFRKLKSLEIHLSDRLTAIGGLNGIGKSTILGIIANGSGISHPSIKSYFDLAFQAQFHELFHLTKDDYINTDKKPYFDLYYDINGEEFIKHCNVTLHKDKGRERLRIVPRSKDKEKGKVLGIGPDAKVNIPTLYLGMSRMLPLGEIEKEKISIKTLKAMSSQDIQYLMELFRKIGQFNIDEDNQSIIGHDIKYFKKRTKLVKLKHNSLSISLGQDSLSSIFTALVSFYRLKREDSNYKSGILVIDELDAGLHHSVQIKLIQLLRKEARKLNLQIIFTTHSLTIFKEILNISDEQKEKGKILDNVVYMYDTHTPKVYINPTYLNIKNNQLTQFTNFIPNKKIKVYFEDNESLWFFEQLIKSLQINDFKTRFHIDIELISLKLSCSMLLQLANADNYFQKVIIVLDNDVISEQNNRNIIEKHVNFIVLPGKDNFNDNTNKYLRTPERILYELLQDKVSAYDENFWNELSTINGGQIDYDYIKDVVLTIKFSHIAKGKLREEMKDWFIKHKDVIEKINLFSYWAKENPNSLSNFETSLNKAVDFVAKEIWPND